MGSTRFPTCWQVAVASVLATYCQALLFGMQLSSQDSALVKEFRTPEESVGSWELMASLVSGWNFSLRLRIKPSVFIGEITTTKVTSLTCVVVVYSCVWMMPFSVNVCR